jgi:hypothetical protein
MSLRRARISPPRHIDIHSHPTSIRLEQPFWYWLKTVAAARQQLGQSPGNFCRSHLSPAAHSAHDSTAVASAAAVTAQQQSLRISSAPLTAIKIVPRTIHIPRIIRGCLWPRTLNSSASCASVASAARSRPAYRPISIPSKRRCTSMCASCPPEHRDAGASRHRARRRFDRS